MKITYRATGDASVSTKLEVIDADTILVDGTVYQVPVDQVSTDAQGPIQSGYRDPDGTLHLVIHGVYCNADRSIWETPPYRGTFEETWSEYDNPDHGVPVIITTGKTQSDLDAQAKIDQVNSLKSDLASLDSVISRSTEDLYLATGSTPFPSVQTTIDKKNDLRKSIKQLE